MSGNTLFILFLLGVILFDSVAAASRPKPQMNMEEDCEEEENTYDNQGRPTRIGAQRPRVQADDDWDGVSDPTDEDYLRYENTNQEGICLLERGKCPAGDWQMFKRSKEETVCLKLIGRQHTFDGHTGGEICRQEANARLMTVDSQEERKWILSTPLGGNATYPWVLIAGYRNRECQMNPFKCLDHQNAFNAVDGTSDHKYIFSKWRGIHNRYQHGYLDDCISYFTTGIPVDTQHQIEDFTCADGWYRVALCGVTVM
uniref:C-type lectin domain-containing protein n=1 Tax=Caenorhabditis tropicalis TaxID=1561998 RepID=A0A1I7SZN8_9PELO